MDHIWLALLWVVYFIIHSMFALTSVKNFFFRRGLEPRTYRLFYVIFALVFLAGIVLFSATIQSDHIFSPNKIWKLSGLILAGWGFIVAKEGFKSYDTKAFLGLGSLLPEEEFKSDGLLMKVRHPLYSGSVLMVLGYFLFDPKVTTLISVSLVILYILIGIQLEERKLIKSFGTKYLEYKKKTPMLIPKFWKKT